MLWAGQGTVSVPSVANHWSALNSWYWTSVQRTIRQIWCLKIVLSSPGFSLVSTILTRIVRSTDRPYWTTFLPLPLICTLSTKFSPSGQEKDKICDFFYNKIAFQPNMYMFISDLVATYPSQNSFLWSTSVFFSVLNNYLVVQNLKPEQLTLKNSCFWKLNVNYIFIKRFLFSYWLFGKYQFLMNNV